MLHTRRTCPFDPPISLGLRRKNRARARASLYCCGVAIVSAKKSKKKETHTPVARPLLGSRTLVNKKIKKKGHRYDGDGVE